MKYFIFDNEKNIKISEFYSDYNTALRTFLEFTGQFEDHELLFIKENVVYSKFIIRNTQ